MTMNNNIRKHTHKLRLKVDLSKEHGYQLVPHRRNHYAQSRLRIFSGSCEVIGIVPNTTYCTGETLLLIHQSLVAFSYIRILDAIVLTGTPGNVHTRSKRLTFPDDGPWIFRSETEIDLPASDV
jgi:hypothetical protein